MGDNPIVAFISFTYLHVFIYSFFNDTVSDVENTPSNYWIIKTNEIGRMWTLSCNGLTLYTPEMFSGCTELITSVTTAYVGGAKNEVHKSVWHTRFCKLAPNISG